MGERLVERIMTALDEQLERAFFLAAFAALADPISRTHSDRERAQTNATTPPDLPRETPYQSRPVAALPSAA
ncbi:hypothetical protein ACWEOZ_17575 [Actinoplanes sp. NPDC004185]